jgi:hypothetical protein
LITLVAAAASLAGLFNDYAADDLHLIAEDPRAHSFADPLSVWAAPYWPAPFNRDLYRPLATLSFQFEWMLGDGSPVVFRVVSYLLYVAASLAVLALARRFLPELGALGVALLFAAHPVHVEAVAQGVNQGEQLVGLLSVIATVRYLDIRRQAWPTAPDWLTFCLIYVVGCLFKENALVMPGLFLAAELALLRDAPLLERARKLGPGIAGMAVLGGIFLAVRARILGSFVGSFTADAWVGLGGGGRLLTMLQVVPHWLRLLLWPAHLHGDYSPAFINQASTWGATQTLGALLLVGLAAAAWLARRKLPVVTFGLLWCGIAIVPVSNVLLPTGIVLAERTLFLPSVGFLLAVGGFVAWAVATRGVSLVKPLAYATGVLVLAGVIRSAVRQRDWQDHYTFWATTAEDTPLSYKGHYAYGELLSDRGDHAGAVRALTQALTLNPSAYWVHNEMGDVYQRMGDCEAALKAYGESLEINSAQVMTRLARMSCLVRLGRVQEAQAEADAAERLRQNPPPP